MESVQVEQRVQTVCLVALASIAVGVALHVLRPVMIPFVLAVFFSLSLSPLVDLQMRYLRLPRWLALLGTLALGLVALAILAGLISTSLRQLAANSAGYQQQVELLLTRAAHALPLELLGWSEQQVLDPLKSIPVGAVGRMLRGTTTAILDAISQSLLVLVFMVYLMIGSAGGEGGGGARAVIQGRVQRYLMAQAAISAATGVLVGLSLMLLGIDLALVFGLFAFLLNFIPSIGSIVATLMPLPVVLVSPDVTPLVAVLAIAIPGSIQLTIGNFVAPKIMGDSLDLHPVAILLALMVWGMVWGVVGMLLATPITAVLKILFERLELTRPLAALLAGRL